MSPLGQYELSRPALQVITSDKQNEQYIAVLLEIESKSHLSAEDRKYAALLAALIEKYEKENHQIPSASPIEVLVELIEANDLRQKDLVSIFGTESVVSEIVNGRRPLSKTHIELLSKRFRVSPAIFFPRNAVRERER
jgi:HTH-type transcriptional regulator / antitoxin HigA